MTIQTQEPTTARFDAEGYARAFEAWDIPALLTHYAEDLELTLVTPEHPPARPIMLQGTDKLQRMWEQGVSAGAIVTVRRVVVGDGCAAITYHCEFPGKHLAVANAIVDLKDGLIMRQHEVLVGGAVEEVVTASEVG